MMMMLMKSAVIAELCSEAASQQRQSKDQIRYSTSRTMWLTRPQCNLPWVMSDEWRRQFWTLLRLCNSSMYAQLQVAEAVRTAPSAWSRWLLSFLRRRPFLHVTEAVRTAPSAWSRWLLSFLRRRPFIDVLMTLVKSTHQ